MKSRYIDFYSRAFSQQRIDGTLTFDQSPLAQSTIAKMSAFMAQLMQAAPAVMTTPMSQFHRLSQDATRWLIGDEESKGTTLEIARNDQIREFLRNSLEMDRSILPIS